MYFSQQNSETEAKCVFILTLIGTFGREVLFFSKYVLLFNEFTVAEPFCSHVCVLDTQT